jgi:hypothetical protein
MQNDDLATYLKDHLAGSVGAIEMIDHLIETYEGKPIADFCKQLRDDINADQDELREIMRALEVKEGSVRKAGAWIGEKLGRIKLRLEGEGSGDPGLFLALEALVLGITGKRILWRALTAVQSSWPQLQRFDLNRLQQRALEQIERVDAKRLEVATEALRAADS